MLLILLSLQSDEAQSRFTQLWNENSKRLLKMVYNSINNVETAQELVGDAFTALIANYDRYNSLEDNQLKALLITITKNIVKNYYKKSERIKFVSTTYINNDNELEDYDYEDESYNLENYVINQDTVSRIEEAISSLDDKYRDVLRLKLFVGMKYDEIAEELHISKDLVRKRYERGVSQVIKMLGENNHEK